MEKQSSKPVVNIDQQRRHFLSGSVGLGLVGAGMAAGLVSGSAAATTLTKSDRMANYKAEQLERVTEELMPPPMVPKHELVAKGKPKVVQVKLVSSVLIAKTICACLGGIRMSVLQSRQI